MKIFYFHDPMGNFGDDLNAWIWDSLLPGHQAILPEAHVVGIGTLLNAQLPLPEGKKVVMGSGVGYGVIPNVTDMAQWDVRAVRGPLTQRRMGLPERCATVDPAALLPNVMDVTPRHDPTGDALFIPHCSNTSRHDWEVICRKAGLRYVSPRGPSRDVVRAISGASVVIAESLHAAIVADAFRVPWIAVSVSGMLNEVKWVDWALSLSIPLQVNELFPELLRRNRSARRIDICDSSDDVDKALQHFPILSAQRLQKEEYILPICQVDHLGRALPPPKPPRKARDILRTRIERVFIADRLRTLRVRTQHTLSDAGALKQAQTHFSDVLWDVRRDYGLL